METTTFEPNGTVFEANGTSGLNSYNGTEFELPIDMRFNEGHVVSIVTYSVLMVISAIGNSTVLILILKRRGNRRSRINTMLMHLAIADLLVTFVMMPCEIGWAVTVTWEAGDAMCRIMAFFRVFGLCLSSFVLVCISVDRYYAVLKPLQLTAVDKRGKVMLTMAWGGSTLCSMPQMVVFHVENHPNVTWYAQCITYNTFPTYTHELTYSLFGMVMMYALPLIIIIYSYSSIICEIYKRSRESLKDKIRRSSLGFLGRAKIRTLKMTIIIVLVFFICWTPYYVMSLWYWIDRLSASKVDQRIQRGLFLFACTNSCMNPVVYGAFNIRSRKRDSGTLQRVASCTIRGTRGAADVVCRVSWHRSMNESQHHLVRPNEKLVNVTLSLFPTQNTNEPKVTDDQKNQLDSVDPQLQSQTDYDDKHCFTVSPL